MQMGCVMCHDSHCSSRSQAHEQRIKRGSCRWNLTILSIRSESKTSICCRPQSATQQGRHWNTNKLGFIHFGIFSKNLFGNSINSIYRVKIMLDWGFDFLWRCWWRLLNQPFHIGGWRKWFPNSFHFGIEENRPTFQILQVFVSKFEAFRMC